MKIIGEETASGATLAVPDDWHGQAVVTELGGWIIQASNLSFAGVEDALGASVASRLEGDDLFITVFDVGPLPKEWLINPENGWVFTDGPASISKADFGSFGGIGAPSYALTNVVLRAREIQIGVGFGTANPSDEDLARANGILTTLTVPPPSGEQPLVGTTDLPAEQAAR